MPHTILIDINHPAHVHFFRVFITKRRALGDRIVVTASDKDIAIELLKQYNIPFIHLGSYGKSVWSKLLNVPIMALKMLSVARRERPDIMLGLGSSRITHAGFVLGIKSVVFTDTEHAAEQILLYRYFADAIVTPHYFKRDMGKKHIRYHGFHDLAYLHPSHFKPDVGIRKKLEATDGRGYAIVRFVSWEATHDFGHAGFNRLDKVTLIDTLSSYGKVYISSETVLPPEFERLRFPLSFTDMHSALAFASIYIGEGGTMATEAAVLGVPSIFVNSLRAGVFDSLVSYGLLCQTTSMDRVLDLAKDILEDETARDRWQIKRKQMLAENVNVSELINDVVERLNNN